jgi:hypothetical protein
MPCNGDYLDSNNLEKELTKVLLLLDELAGKGAPDPRDYNAGYDPRAYLKANKKTLDAKVAELCSACKNIPNISEYSLELQMWWRDHQIADKQREGRSK